MVVNSVDYLLFFLLVVGVVWWLFVDFCYGCLGLALVEFHGVLVLLLWFIVVVVVQIG